MLERAATAILGRPRLAVAAVVIVAGLVGIGVRYGGESASTPRVFGGPSTPPALEAMLAELLSGEACHHPTEMAVSVREGLSRAGLSDWTVRTRTEVKPSDCVSAAPDAERREVVLNLAMSPELKRAINGVAEQLLASCFNRDAAERLLRTALTDAGATTFDILTTGSEAGPIEREAEIHAHFEAGCWIYSATGWGADGTPLYVIGGKS